MPKEIRGSMSAGNTKFAVVVSRYNEFITSRLTEGALETVERHGGSRDLVTVAYVPGAFELPQVARRLAASAKFDAIICLGCIIRGQTPHFDFIAAEAAKGIAQVSMSTDVPTTFGVITADTLEQAVERAGAKAGNKGAEAAASAIELVNLLHAIS